MINSIKRICSLLAVLSLLGLPGCMGYRLGSTLPHDVESVYVPTFINKTSEPLIEVDMTDATIAEFQQDGTLEIANEAEADAILEVTLNEFKLDAVGFESDDQSKVDQYRMLIYCKVVFIRRSTGEVLVEVPRLEGRDTFNYSADLTTAKNEAMPNLAADLANRIVSKVVECW